MTSARPGLAEVVIADDPDAWRAAGFEVGERGECRVGPTILRLIGPIDAARGVTGWTLRHVDASGLRDGRIDGLPTVVTYEDERPDACADHPNGATVIDHVVVVAPDLARTVDAFDAVGLTVRGTRDATAGDRAIRQHFLRLGPTLVEVVGSPDKAGAGDAGFYGLAFTVADLDAAAGVLGPALGPPGGAVQPGRRIATVRHRDLGLSVPVALMTPEAAPR